MAQDKPHTTSEQQPAPEQPKHSLTARLLTALAFGWVGAKAGLIGSIQDANALFDKSATLGQKIRGTFSGEMLTKLKQQVAHKIVNEGKGKWAAIASVFKYTLITTAIGTGVGVALGWVRGGRVESWKDIFSHPWRSTKLVFGLESPSDHKKAETPAAPQKEMHPVHEETDPEKKHADDVVKYTRLKEHKPREHKPSASHVEASSKPDAGISRTGL